MNEELPPIPAGGKRNLRGSAARIGIGGPVGSGKTLLLERLTVELSRRGIAVCVITNDLVTAEDAERVRSSGIIDPRRVLDVEAGACPHTVIREDPSMNMEAADRLEKDFPDTEVILLESGGDNLASTFSSDLVDYWLFVIDVAGGGDIPRKRGPGVLLCDALVINKTDLAPHVNVDLETMATDALTVRENRAVVLTNCMSGEGVSQVADLLMKEVVF